MLPTADARFYVRGGTHCVDQESKVPLDLGQCLFIHIKNYIMGHEQLGKSVDKIYR